MKVCQAFDSMPPYLQCAKPAVGRFSVPVVAPMDLEADLCATHCFDFQSVPSVLEAGVKRDD